MIIQFSIFTTEFNYKAAKHYLLLSQRYFLDLSCCTARAVLKQEAYFGYLSLHYHISSQTCYLLDQHFVILRQAGSDALVERLQVYQYWQPVNLNEFFYYYEIIGVFR